MTKTWFPDEANNAAYIEPIAPHPSTAIFIFHPHL
jgi:hypothetical protein